MHARRGEQLCSSRHHCLSIHSHRRWTRQVPGRLPWVKTRKDLPSDTGGSGSGTLSPDLLAAIQTVVQAAVQAEAAKALPRPPTPPPPPSKCDMSPKVLPPHVIELLLD